MDTNALKKFAQAARNLLIDQVTSKLDLVLVDGSAAWREHPQAMKDLDAAIARDGRQQVIEQVAYTWFNRFTALRFMDANDYTSVGIVSPADGQTRPEILSEAMAGNFPEDAPERVVALLDGRIPSSDPQAEAYRLLLVHACNQWHGPMPFMFEQIDDYSELLMPEDLLSQTSILAEVRAVMTDDACQDVEIIGWLYQFYISEKKDQVFAGLKKNQKITAENIPAATQLFTPHWIVRYLVENSLGRLWLLNRPDSKLAERMDYYIAPEEPETDFLKITKPEDIRICDPAAGSGHMLTYAFDLLYAIYEEEGYDATEIPALILTHNLTGVEIDDRAGALAAFALAMKAAAKLGRRRFLRMEAKPDICVLQNVAFTDAEMQDVAAVVGRDLFTDALRETLGQFEQAKNFGSLIVPKLRDPAEALRVVEAKRLDSDLLLRPVLDRLAKVLLMAEALSPRYHMVVANPPYMGSKEMNGKLGDFAKEQYPDSKSDLFAIFMERTLRMSVNHGMMAMINMQSWMFLSSFEKLRGKLLSNATLLSMAHLGERGFDTIGGAVVSTTAFVFQNAHHATFKGNYVRLVDGANEAEKAAQMQEAIKNNDCGWFYRASAKDFEKVPGIPISYWLSDTFRSAFSGENFVSKATPIQGIITGKTDHFLRLWPEIGYNNVRKPSEPTDNQYWVPYAKGGEGRKWYGNNEHLLNWKNEGRDLVRSRSTNSKYYFQPCLTWTLITSSDYTARYCPEGFLWDVAGSIAFPNPPQRIEPLLGFLCSNVCRIMLKSTNPTMNTNIENIENLPIREPNLHSAIEIFDSAVGIAKSDWDAYETSWDFTTLPLLHPDHRAETMEHTYTTLRTHWQGMTDEMQRLEEENNRIFIDAYGLQDELTPEVPLNEITLTCNPAYRYGIKNDAAANEARLRADTMAEFLSYAVGCMFGRYSVDAPGLILANQGETLAEYLARIPEPSFTPDDDNVIPVLDADWFADDITERFRLFLRVTFGEDHFQENLRYIEDALGKDLRKYFTKDFYADHVKRYKKRPIYWLFSSSKGSFQALVYMHRYRSDTVSVVLNDYLREYISKLEGERGRLEKLSDDASAGQAQRTKALKDMAGVGKQIEELNAWERDVVFPMAQQKIEIDLDDGVKANYPKFGTALKKIPGLEAKND
jgi:type II restriction/modification system DNA methylase subunit YeeA